MEGPDQGHGKALLRGGFDFWKNAAAQFIHRNGNNTEGAAGFWHGPSPKWVEISACIPKRP